jgi:3-phenylpropionate/trans-cinnamate dioxygenase ferredoxin component
MPLLIRAAHVDEVPPGTSRSVKVRGQKVLLCNSGGTIHAIGARCPHMGLPLAAGDFDGRTVVCRYHGARVDVATGRLLDKPGNADWKGASFGRKVAALLGSWKKAREGCGSYRVEVRGNQVFIAVDADTETAPASVQANPRPPADLSAPCAAR